LRHLDVQDDRVGPGRASRRGRQRLEPVERKHDVDRRGDEQPQQLRERFRGISLVVGYK